MAVEWIKSYKALGRHPKTKTVARLLGLDLPTVVGHLHYLWWWAVDFAPDGDVTKYDAHLLAEEAGWKGDPRIFLAALTEVGFIENTPDGQLLLHDWEHYTGAVAGRQSYMRDYMRGKRGTQPTIITEGVYTDEEPEPEPPVLALPEPKPKRKRPASEAPDTFEVVDELWSWAQENGWCGTRAHLEFVTQNFLDTHRSKGNRFVDWKRAWYTWVRNSISWGHDIPKEAQGGTNKQGAYGQGAGGTRPIPKQAADVENRRRFEEIAGRRVPPTTGG